MTQLLSSETKLEGSWVFRNGKHEEDETCRRIKWLIRECLEQVEAGNWEATYRDPKDGRCWLLCYPKAEMHGGGPPCLEVIERPHSK
ncbi:Imm27 family immunity protein [Maricaulis sp. CAU 1757]